MTGQIQKQSNFFLSTGLAIIMFHFNAFDYTLTVQSNELNFARSLVFCVVFCRLLFVFLFCFFLLTIVFSDLQFTDSDHPFRIFKVFFIFTYLQYLSSWWKFISLYRTGDQTSVNLIQALPTLMTRCPWAIKMSINNLKLALIHLHSNKPHNITSVELLYKHHQYNSRVSECSFT